MTKDNSFKTIVSKKLEVANKEKERTVRNYQIEMLDVGSVNAIVISYKEDDKNQKFVLVDVGRYSKREKIKNHLKEYYS